MCAVPQRLYFLDLVKCISLILLAVFLKYIVHPRPDNVRSAAKILRCFPRNCLLEDLNTPEIAEGTFPISGIICCAWLNNKKFTKLIDVSIKKTVKIKYSEFLQIRFLCFFTFLKSYEIWFSFENLFCISDVVLDGDCRCCIKKWNKVQEMFIHLTKNANVSIKYQIKKQYTAYKREEGELLKALIANHLLMKSTSSVMSK